MCSSVRHSPEPYQSRGCEIGYGAYKTWISGVEKQGGHCHGNWWNGMVWLECRRQAARFFEEIREMKLVRSESALKRDFSKIEARMERNC
jgi:hypothetical protein